jgi:hypothetical protein
MITMTVTIIRDYIVNHNEKGVFGVPDKIENLYTKIWKFWDRLF